MDFENELKKYIDEAEKELHPEEKEEKEEKEDEKEEEELEETEQQEEEPKEGEEKEPEETADDDDLIGEFEYKYNHQTLKKAVKKSDIQELLQKAEVLEKYKNEKTELKTFYDKITDVAKTTGYEDANDLLEKIKGNKLNARKKELLDSGSVENEELAEKVAMAEYYKESEKAAQERQKLWEKKNDEALDIVEKHGEEYNLQNRNYWTEEEQEEITDRLINNPSESYYNVLREKILDKKEVEINKKKKTEERDNKNSKSSYGKTGAGSSKVNKKLTKEMILNPEITSLQDLEKISGEELLKIFNY